MTVTLNNQEWATFLQTRKDGDYSIARNGWIADYNDPMSFLDMWLTGGGNNDAQYSNAEYDAKIQAAKASTDPAERMQLMHEAEDIIMGQDYALCPLYFYTQKYMLADGICTSTLRSICWPTASRVCTILLWATSSSTTAPRADFQPNKPGGAIWLRPVFMPGPLVLPG